MKAHAPKSGTVSPDAGGKRAAETVKAAESEWADERPEAAAQRQVRAMADSSPLAQRQSTVQRIMDSSPRATAQAKSRAMLDGAGPQKQTRAESSAKNAPEVIQRVISRGQGTGWGLRKWVEGGEAVWTDLEKLFNTTLLTQIPLVTAAKTDKEIGSEFATILTELEKLRNDHDGHDIYWIPPDGVQGGLTAIAIRDQLKTATEKAQTLLDSKPALRKAKKATVKSYEKLVEKLDAMTQLDIGQGAPQSALTGRLANLRKKVVAQVDSDSPSPSELTTISADVTTLAGEFELAEAAESERARRKSKVDNWRKSLLYLSTAIGDFPLPPVVETVSERVTDNLRAYIRSGAADVDASIEASLESLAAKNKARKIAEANDWTPGGWAALAGAVADPASLNFILKTKKMKEYDRITEHSEALAGIPAADAMASSAAWEDALERINYIERGDGCRELTLRWADDLKFRHLQTYRAADSDVAGTTPIKFLFSRKFRMTLGTTETVWELHIHYSMTSATDPAAAGYIHFTTISGGRTNPVASAGYDAVLGKLPISAGKDASVMALAASHFT